MTPRSHAVPGTAHSDAIITSFLLSNIHCPTCVTTIQSVLQESSCGPHIRWISPNVVTSVVTVEHSPLATVGQLESILEEAGFDLCAATKNCFNASRDSKEFSANDAVREDAGQNISTPVSGLVQWIMSSDAPSRIPAAREQRVKAHLANCAKCRTFMPDDNDNKPPPALIIRPPSSSGILDSTSAHKSLADLSRKPSPEKGSYEDSPQARLRATLAVGGMTCAVCVNTITDELSKRDWISKVVVSLVTNSATVEFDDDDKLHEIIEAIEDLGYEATLDTLVPLDKEKSVTQERTVDILFQGVYCPRCPPRVARSLAGFRRQIEILDEPTEERPIMRIRYVPDAPAFTIRHILAAIEAGDPALSASVYHPATIEERSKQILRRHQLRLLYRVVLTGIICVPTFILGVVFMSLVPSSNATKRYLTAPWTAGISRLQISLFVMATPVYSLAADMFHTRAIKEIKALWRRGSRTPILQRCYRFGSMNTLISSGTTIAYVSSVAQLIAAWASHSHVTKNSSFYFDSVVFLTFFLLIGRLVESVTKARTGETVETLGKLRPTSAILVEHSNTEKEQSSVVSIDLLDFGDVVRVPHGASPPADGIIIQGETIFEESGLTGESRPVRKTVGDDAFSGTVNKGVPVLVQVTGVAGKSMLDQIVEVVRESQTMRAPIEQIADVLTSYFVPVITLIAILTWLIWMSLGLSGSLPDDWLDVTSGGWVAWSLQFATAVFIVACPCGLALAAPTAIFVGGGIAAKQGILAKGGGEAFQKASKIDCVVFDKTGTITRGGEPSITDAEIFPDDIPNDDCVDKGHNRTMLLAAIKGVEEASSHPIAKAIASFCASQTACSETTLRVEDIEEIPGRGMKATYFIAESCVELVIGNEALMADMAVTISPRVVALLQGWKTEAKSVTLAATSVGSVSPLASTSVTTATKTMTTTTTGYKLVVAFSISDPVRLEAISVIRELHASRIDVWLLSGDNPTTTAAVASQVGIDPAQVIAGVLPMEKAEKIKYLQRTLKARVGHNRRNESNTRRATVAMVGDGVNDAPALATADVAIAIGSGSDVAITSAAFVLLNSQLNSVVTLLDLSRAVFHRIRFNFAWALVYNCIAIPVAAGCFFPIHTGGRESHVRLDPVWASLAMALSSISVVTSSLALRSRLPWIGFRTRNERR